MRYKVAIIEDDDLIRGMIQINLSKNNYEIYSFSNCEDISSGISIKEYDLIVLDIVLPGISGVDFLKTLRGNQVSTPVLMISVKEDIKSKLLALDIGADDYLVKPFNMDELIARVNAIIRRNHSINKTKSNINKIGKYSLNLFSRICESNFGEVTLSEKEILLLKFFLKNEEKILSRADILEEVWGMDSDPTPRTIDNFILKFRKLFELDPANPNHFITIRNKGYLFKS